MFYLFHGEDELAIAEAAAQLRARMAEEDPLAELNTSTLDGRRLTVAELQAAADALPFMGDRRLVLVERLVGRCNPRTGDKGAGRKALADDLTAYLDHVPPTTRLVLLEGRLEKDNPVLRWAARREDGGGESGLVRAFDPPEARAMPGWIAARARAAGGLFEPAAAAALAAALDRDGRVDLRLAAGEVEKLLTYADGRAVTPADVEALVMHVGLESVFRLVDALGDGDGRRAATRLHELLDDGEHPLRLLALVVRQFRQLARTRAHLDQGGAAGALPRLLGVPPFAGRKLANQARRFDAVRIRTLLARLLAIDEGIKTGAVDGALALDLFVAEVCGARVRS